MRTRTDSRDEVELTSVGLDIGSATSHAVFSRLRLRRMAHHGSMKYVPVERTVLWESPVILTPYVRHDEIDSAALSAFLGEQHRSSGLARRSIDCGAVILTGTALLRKNSRTITESLALESGKFVCATAGHDLEARLSAAGSGSVSHSMRTGQSVLNIDIGGGTTKFAMIKDGDILDTAVLTLGSRIVAFDDRRTVTRVEESAGVLAGDRTAEIALGAVLSTETEDGLITHMVEVLAAMIRGEHHLLLPDVTVLGADTWPWNPDAIRFSGGVSKYAYGADDAGVGDLGWRLGRAVRDAAVAGEFTPARVLDAGESIRATVIGASQFSVQVSGDTTTVPDSGVLPLRNVRVVRPRLNDVGDATSIAAAVSGSLRQLGHADEAFALAIHWEGSPEYARTRALADGIVRGLGDRLVGERPLIVGLDGDLGLTLGRMLRIELGVSVPVICIDGLRLDDFEFIDIGVPLEGGTVPVVIKSLVFPDHAMPAR